MPLGLTRGGGGYVGPGAMCGGYSCAWDAHYYFCFSLGLHLPGRRELKLHSSCRAFCVGCVFASHVRLSKSTCQSLVTSSVVVTVYFQDWAFFFLSLVGSREGAQQQSHCIGFSFVGHVTRKSCTYSPETSDIVRTVFVCP